MTRLLLNDPLVRRCFLCLSVVFSRTTSALSYGWIAILWYKVNLSLLLSAIIFRRSRLLAVPINLSDMSACLKGRSCSIGGVLSSLNGILGDLSDVLRYLRSLSCCINKEMIYQ